MARRKALPEPYEAVIEELDHDGRARYATPRAGIVWGGLPGERVKIEVHRRARGKDLGQVVEVLAPHPNRVVPPCPEFGRCAGCSLQHLDPAAQLEHKQGQLARALAEAGVEVPRWLAPLRSTTTGYRRRARLAVKWVEKKGKVLVGFREVRDRRFVADIARCEVLVEPVQDLPALLSELVARLSVRDALPQVEVAVGDNAVVLVMRILRELVPADELALQAFEDQTGFSIYLQPGGLDTVHPLRPGSERTLEYSVGIEGPRLAFLPTDFVQVHADLNAKMVEAALEALDLAPDDAVLDLFCGIGNFTLPLAQRIAGGRVHGVEGDAALVERAKKNASSVPEATPTFERADLYGELEGAAFLGQQWPKVLLDPPRSGAGAVLTLLPGIGACQIVYVSCGPTSLVRDLTWLCANGYGVSWVRVMDMFPHTAHVEVMALIERRDASQTGSA